MRREDLVKNLGFKINKDSGEKIEDFLFVSAVAILVQRPAFDAIDEQLARSGTVRVSSIAVAKDGDERLEAKENVAEEEACIFEWIACGVEHGGCCLNGLASLDGYSIDRTLCSCFFGLVLDLSNALHVVSESVETGKLFDKGVQNGSKNLCCAIRSLCEDGLDEVEEELDTHGLDAWRERGIVKDLGMDVNDADELCR